MNVAIRTDASTDIGSGHLMRCLAIAEELRRVGHKILFLLSNRERKWIELIRAKKYEYEAIDAPSSIVSPSNAYEKNPNCPNRFRINVDWQEDALETESALRSKKTDWLIVDHYGLDWRWESFIRGNTNRIMVIDDLADRKHDCDILVDCVYGRQTTEYKHLVPSHCKLLLGTRYALLRREFSMWRNYAINRRSQQPNAGCMLISLGGVDADNMTGKVLSILGKVDCLYFGSINVVFGPGFKHEEKIKNMIAKFPKSITLHSNVNNMAERVANADFGIGAFGVSTWERFCLGLPSINIITESNQVGTAAKLQNLQFAGIVFSQTVEKDIFPCIRRLLGDRRIYERISCVVSDLVDGKGICRVVQQMKNLS